MAFHHRPDARHHMTRPGFSRRAFLRALNAVPYNGRTSMRITIVGVFLASAFMTVGCAQAIARHDLFERSDSRIGRVVGTARRTCQEEQPKKALPSVAEYERCVLEELRRADLTLAR